MKFVSFTQEGRGTPRFGLAVENAVIDLTRSYDALLSDRFPAEENRNNMRMLSDALAFISGGEAALSLARCIRDLIAGDASSSPKTSQTSIFQRDQVKLEAPLANPRKFIAAGKNFSEHMAEMSSRIPLPRRPVAFAQMMTTIVGPDTAIPFPPETTKLDYEVEIAVVIGRPARNIDASAASDHIFGYTLFNDISARDIYREEQANGIPLLGKNLLGFSPLGPALVTRDEFAHGPDVRLMTRVNGEVRQNGVLSNMIFGIDALIAYWSKIGLEPGDILTTGTPSGVAAGRKPEETPWWLKPGDVVEIEVPGLGVLRNTIGTV